VSNYLIACEILSIRTALIFAWLSLSDLWSSGLANGSNTTSARTTTSSTGHASRSARDSELAGSDMYHHDSPLARDEMTRHRSDGRYIFYVFRFFSH